MLAEPHDDVAQQLHLLLGLRLLAQLRHREGRRDQQIGARLDTQRAPHEHGLAECAEGEEGDAIVGLRMRDVERCVGCAAR